MNLRFVSTDPLPSLRNEAMKGRRGRDLEKSAYYLLKNKENIGKLVDSDLGLSDGKRNLADYLLEKIRQVEHGEMQPQYLIALAAIVRNRKIVGDEIHRKAYGEAAKIDWWGIRGVGEDYVSAFRGLDEAVKSVWNQPVTL